MRRTPLTSTVLAHLTALRCSSQDAGRVRVRRGVERARL
jgi:hypothetical protein